MKKYPIREDKLSLFGKPFTTFQKLYFLQNQMVEMEDLRWDKEGLETV